MEQDSAAVVGGPLKVVAKETVDGAHKFHSDFGGQEAFKSLLNCCVLEEIDKIVNVEPDMDRLVSG